MSELRSLIEAARALRQRGEASLIATVVDVHGSSYRKPGARMLFTAERWLAGSVSGGCLERDIVAKGPWRTRDARARLVTYDGALDERSGSGCDGVIDVLVERAGAAGDLTDPINLAARCLESECRGVLFTAFRSSRPEVPVGAHHALLASGEGASTWPAGAQQETLQAHALTLLSNRAVRPPAPHVLHLAGVDVLVELVVPPTHLFLFGGAHDALPLLGLAKAIGWSVTVCEPHAQLVARERFRAADQHLVGPLENAIAALERCARPAAVVMAHHYERDLAALEALVRSCAPYIGLLGARSRAARLLADVESRGFALDERTRQRLHAPVGLAIGAESPQEIALSIVAEVQAQLASAARLAATDEATPLSRAYASAGANPYQAHDAARVSVASGA
jgi:xanthine dehydrogenase accessory factor